MTTTYANEHLRNAAIVEAILLDPSASDREISRRTGTSHPTVAKLRELVEVGSYEAAPSRESWEQMIRYYTAKTIALRDACELLSQHGIEVPE